MEQTIDEDTTTPATPNQPWAAKRRKLRKGTRSCWECKHRKTSCVFASPHDSSCKGCQRRRLPCISQEVPEDEAITAIGGNRDLNARLARVEDLMRNVLANPQAVAARETWHDLRPSNPNILKASSTSADSSPSYRLPPAYTERLLEEPAPPEPTTSLQDRRTVSDLPRSTLSTAEASSQRNLLAAFPCAEDAQLLLREGASPSFYTHLVCTQPHSRLTRELVAKKTPPVLELPGPDTHPVIVATLMLKFAITLQSPCANKLHGLSESHDTLIQRLTAAASTLVTTKSEMHGTVESLLCVMLEGVVETNRGNLRQAWAVNRRAMMIAQLMGLHRSPIPPLKHIDSALNASPEFIWFRIVYIDRYLSILLNLPQGTPDNTMAFTMFLLDEPPLGRFERLLTVAASRIIERNQRYAETSKSITGSIDAELLNASNSMPSSFWRPVDFEGLVPGSSDALLETLRVSAHVYYYGLLLQLHLPYLFHGKASDDHDEYSRMTCVSAAREMVTRFTSHRTFNLISSCSRPVDFFALLASITVMLAHIDAHHYCRSRNILAHQRQSDRALLEKALERMDLLSNVNKDIIGEKSASVIRRLLAIEAEAARGVDYVATAVPGDELQDTRENGPGYFRLQIPYLGAIKIACQSSLPKDPWAGAANPPVPDQVSSMDLSDGSQFTPESGAQSDMVSNNPRLNQTRDGPHSSVSQLSLPPTDVDFPGITANIDDWTFQGIDMAFFDGLLGENSGLQ